MCRDGGSKEPSLHQSGECIVIADYHVLVVIDVPGRESREVEVIPTHHKMVRTRPENLCRVQEDT